MTIIDVLKEAIASFPFTAQGNERAALLIAHANDLIEQDTLQ